MAVTLAANNFWIIFESANPCKASLYLQGLGLYIEKVNKIFRSKEPSLHFTQPISTAPHPPLGAYVLNGSPLS